MTEEQSALVEQWAGLPRSIAKKVYYSFNGQVNLLDIRSEGNIGLVRAAMTWVPEKCPAFPKYAAFVIKRRMTDFAMRESRCRKPQKVHVFSKVEDTMPDLAEMLLSASVKTDHVRDAISRDVVAEVMRRMHPEWRERIQLIMDGYGTKEVGRMQGLSHATISNKRSEAIQQFRRIYWRITR